MKNLNFQELSNAPKDVQFIYFMASLNQSVNREKLELCIKDYPEYFPEEIAFREKWASIPQSVHDAYYEERELLREKCFKDMPASKGILGWIYDPEGYEIWKKSYDKCREIELPLAKALHDKYYEEYGIEYNGW